MFKKPLIIFLSTSLLLSVIFFMFPINLFDGEIVYKSELTEYTVSTRLSLSYFIGIGYDEADMVNVATFYLTWQGIAMAILFILGFPALLAYRIYLKRTKQ